MLPYPMTGNIEKPDLVGEDLILLGILSIVHPQASQDEMAIYIFSEGVAFILTCSFSNV